MTRDVARLLDKPEGVVVKLGNEEEVQLNYYTQPDGQDVTATTFTA
jgi:hypothetical protein